MRIPFFSVCVPSYNYAHFLSDAIDSVLAQEYGDFELLIRDDASLDRTDEILSSYDDPRIRIQRNAETLGIFANLNLLCAEARGRFIKFLCADDVLFPGCLGLAYHLLNGRFRGHRVVCVRDTELREQAVTGLRFGDDRVFVLDKSTLFRFLGGSDAWGGGLANMFIERECFRHRGFFERDAGGTGFSLDLLTWLDLVLAHGAVMVDVPLVFQRPHPGQARYRLPRLMQLRELLEWFARRSPELADVPELARGRRSFLDQIVASHYWSGIKRLSCGAGTAYLRGVWKLQQEYGYRRIPVAGAAKLALGRIRETMLSGGR